MNYIVMDMEWNQPWPGSPSSKKVLPVPIRGEIIQIGAVRLTEDGEVADEFQVMIRPKFYRHLNRRVSKLTGIKENRLRDEGVPFPEAMALFQSWCGEDIVFLTWGFDDIGILRENLQLFDMDTAFTDRWYNAQMIFNAQTDGSNSQKALKTAMETLGIEATRPAHDALGDAYHTALICARLDLKKGTAEYDEALKSHENGFHGAELPGCVGRAVFHGYADKTAALGAMSGKENRCPVCGGQMTAGKWYTQQGRRYLTKAHCETDGDFYIRVRLAHEDEALRVSRLVYEPTEQVAKSYAALAQKPRARRPRRRRSARVKAKPAEPKNP